MKFTEKDFKQYIIECKKGIKIFGLINYEIVYDFRNSKDSVAGCITDSVSKQITLGLNKKNLDETINELSIDKLALHEVLHGFFAEIKDLAYCRTLDKNIYSSIEHGLIYTLINILIKDESNTIGNTDSTNNKENK